ncbi:FkbM family methyltransferase [Pseudotabrizicola sp.]|uniref:FkbM family methyltransferase n=1 Tax=Pseudotabrizicola sp. TaxID=2939647 RepID=UPI0027322BB5|nr:FkbM family methyltransferase [Pseudotabrizicola sp.]MDP2083225.1 FkbM family methyltransferase [Pseudotabrizicola sp.]
MSTRNVFLRKMAKLYLSEVSEDHARRFPQLACFAFDTISVSLHIDGQYERYELEALEELIFPRMDRSGQAIDVGANIGNHSLFFARHFPSVVSLEPHPRTFRLLACNADLVPNVIALNLGASSAETEISVAQDLLNLGATSVRPSDRPVGLGSKPVTLKLVPIDIIPEVAAAQRVSFIKLDIEGHEEAALRGAEKTLRRHGPIVAMEILPEDINEGSTPSIELLRNLGYTNFIASRPATRIARLPNRTFKRLKALLSLIGRAPSERREFVPVEFPLPPNARYSLLVCSRDPLI